MVMASFSLQVFLFLASGFRKRHSSRVLSVLLWLAYLSANSLAVFALGRLVIRGAGNRLALFWAPFLLLHLGGQETMTAFSMEDNALWKRHLLSLATQVPMAFYVVSKQLRGDDRQLVAPMVLVFVSGTAKYAERIWALRRAGSLAPGKSSSTSNLVSHASNDAAWDTQGYYGLLARVVEEKKETDLEAILFVAADGFKLSLHFFMDMTPSICLLPEDITEIKHALEVFKSSPSENRVHMAYKLAEINLSLIYDYLYTKFGTRHFHIVPACSAFHRMVALSLISGALGLFVRAMAGQKGHDVADLIISYVLLVGAVALETCSIFMSFISSYWAYKTTLTCQLTCPLCLHFPGAIAAMRSIARHLHPAENKGEWSEKLAQYNMIGGCIREKQESGLLRRAMRWIGIDAGAVTRIGVSPDVKKLLLDKLLDIAVTPRAQEWDIGVGKFQGQWAQWVADETTTSHNHLSAAQQVLHVSNIQGLDFVSSALLWHIVTDICLLAAVEDEGVDDVSPKSEHLDSGSFHHANADDGYPHGEHLDSSSSHHANAENDSAHGKHLDSGSSHHENADDGSPHGGHLDTGSSHNANADGSSPHGEHLESSPSHKANANGGSPNGEHLDSGSSHHANANDISGLRGPAGELSDYIMYLIADCGAMAGSEGHYVVIRGRREFTRWLLVKNRGYDRRKVIQGIHDEESSFFHDEYYPVLDRARRVASDLLKIGKAHDRWKLIAAVWLEMLCYIAHNCGAAFHAKHLTTGGEFVSHVKMLLFMLGLPFLRDVKESLLPNRPGNIYS